MNMRCMRRQNHHDCKRWIFDFFVKIVQSSIVEVCVPKDMVFAHLISLLRTALTPLENHVLNRRLHPQNY